jgi:hypothetical protein
LLLPQERLFLHPSPSLLRLLVRIAPRFFTYLIYESLLTIS